MTSVPDPDPMVSLPQGDTLPLVPYPRRLERHPGTLRLARSRFPESNAPHARLAASLLESAGVVRDEMSDVGLSIALDSALNAEGYRLRIDFEGIDIRAGAEAGVFYALQTLNQLLRFGTDLPFLRIEDGPRFAWRGMLLDVARHFMPVQFLRKCIDLLAHHKLNVLHLHLTDDQGWRVEIRKYPRLTEVGSRRARTLLGHGHVRPRIYDDEPHEGFYTQEELRDLVAYAADRHVTIVPEIDLPGHVLAALAAYPELGNELEASPEVCCHWGVFDSVLNLEESTFEFVQNVLLEVFDVFPGPFVHLGGDECRVDEWQRSSRVSERMRELELEHVGHVQPYFMRRMADFVKRHGRTFVGWDEVLKNTRLERDAVVMAWQPRDNSLEALLRGFPVVMTPNNLTYLDHYQKPPAEVEQPLAIGGLTSWEDVYAWTVYPKGTPDALHDRVLGAQVQVWTEYIATPEHAEYMMFPRLCAFGEVVWSYPAERSASDLKERLAAHLPRLDVRSGPL
ncbi:beta-N-acetylhexosaminidase [Deinococcus yavapaiensis]|uniref:beta-N-acetylhexosaminidase n=1 Tax=Deinococcus yavapaiensis KR-236 TaxID=694435 RepID=A0A318S5K3_9DEIO|nr:beta-N-acetylhexosaminidase [Deinococcus yavapaiensis]PYE49442.1 hexosaminidase [Deinococcus yavapaiensis KR-236]